MTSYRTATDQEILQDCRWDAFRASGPGGQKRNKTSSAVRVTHAPTGVAVTAAEHRSQALNKLAALRRLRHRLALDVREPVDLPSFRPPPWFALHLSGGRLGLSPKSEMYLPVMGLVVDVLSAAGWSVSDAAHALSLTTGNLVQFLRDDEKLWAETNRRRGEAGLRPLVGV